jgi:ATP-dependent RNA helicase DbpA
MERDFGALALSPALLSVIEELGFTTLTPIQAQAIPALLGGADVVGESRTGSGKTAAFGLPLLERIDLQRRTPGALVLCPTRELSAQVGRELRKFGRRLPSLAVAVLTGGEPVRFQATALARGVHVVVGTPGRVLDHLRRENLDLRQVATVVLDEADRMLEMGFKDQMEELLKALPVERQTALFSATFPRSIATLSESYQRAPIHIRIESDGAELADTRQLVVRVDEADKGDALVRALEEHPHESALVFANLKVTVARIEKALAAKGLSVASLHGDIEQHDRDRVLAKFRNGSTRVLVATDVAARGLDVDHLDLVVNFDLPPQPEIYIHRIGRTGRAGRTGTALSLVSAHELGALKLIERTTGVALTPTSAAAPPATAVVDERAARTATPAATAVVDERAARTDTLRISGGRKQKVRPGDILGALTGEAGGLVAADVGRIEIHDHFSYVAVSKGASEAARRGLTVGHIKGKKFKVTLVE